jgi:hypothetical protein
MPSSLNQIHSCEVCGNSELRPVLNLGAHPICDDLVPIGDDLGVIASPNSPSRNDDVRSISSRTAPSVLPGMTVLLTATTT